MAPKPNPQDTNPYGAFINVFVQSSKLTLSKPQKPTTPTTERGGKGASAAARKAAEAAIDEGPPQTHVVVTYPGEGGPLASTPVSPGERGVYEYEWKDKFRKEPNLEAMHELINHNLRVAVHDSRTNQPLAWAEVDMLQFGLGISEIDAGTLTLLPNPSAGTYKVVSGKLNGVRLWLTHRSLPPPSRDESATNILTVQSPGHGEKPHSLSRSGTAKSMKEGAPLAPETSEPLPYSFIPPKMAKGCNVIELSVTGGVAPLPPTLHAAVSAASDNKSGSLLHLNLGLKLPGGGPSLVLSNGTLTSAPTEGAGSEEPTGSHKHTITCTHTGGPSLVLSNGTLTSAPTEGAGSEKPAGTTGSGPVPALATHAPPGLFAPNQLSFEPGRKRVLLTAAHVQALVEKLEDGKPLQCEVARILTTDSLIDPIWPAYRAVADLPNSNTFLTPGTSELAPSQPCPLHPVPEQGFKSALPTYTPPVGKTPKVLEEGLPPPAPTAPGTTPPPLPCQWAEAGSGINGLCVRFARPLVPAWKPPPPRPLMELLPPRPDLESHVTANDAVQAFKEQIRQMASALIDLQLNGDDATERDQGGVPSLEQLKAKLAKSGKLAELSEALQRSTVSVAMEQHRRCIGGEQLSEQQQVALLVDLHSSLDTLMNEALEGGSSTEKAAAQQQVEGGEVAQWHAQMAQLLKGAKECEVGGAPKRAEALYLRQIVVARYPPGETPHPSLPNSNSWQDRFTPSKGEPPSPEVQQALYAYAVYCMRRGDEMHGRAEQALRRALGLPVTQCSSTRPGGQMIGETKPVKSEEPLFGVSAAAAAYEMGEEKVEEAQEEEQMAMHVPSLLALTVLLLHHGQVTDSMLLEEALILARKLVKAVSGTDQEPLVWALLLIICQAAGDTAREEDIAASLEGLRCAEASGLVPEATLQPPPTPGQMSATCDAEPSAAGMMMTQQGGEDALPDLANMPAGSKGSSPSAPVRPTSQGTPPSPSQAAASPKQSEGAPSDWSGREEPPSSEQEDIVMCIAPGVGPGSVNGMVGLGNLCATELAMPSVALAALQQSVVELQASSSLPRMTSELELIAAHAYYWNYRWAEIAAMYAGSKFGEGAADGDGADALSPDVPIESRRSQRSQMSQAEDGYGEEMQYNEEGDEGSFVGGSSEESIASLKFGSDSSVGEVRVRGRISLAGPEAVAAAQASIVREEKEEKRKSMAGLLVLEGEQQGGVVNGEGQGGEGVPIVEEEEEPEVDEAEQARARGAEALKTALQLCRHAGMKLGEEDVRAGLLAGELLCCGGQEQEAIHVLTSTLATMTATPAAADKTRKEGGVPLALVLRLGGSYEKLGHHDEALNLYLQACAHSPCATVWMRAARAHHSLGQQAECEAALEEAVALDAESPHVWGTIALIALRGGPIQAATAGKAALACALRLDLKDVPQLQELSSACKAIGMDAEAMSCLEVAVSAAPLRGPVAVATRLQLAQALARANKYEPGRVAYEAALAVSTSRAQQRSVKRSLVTTMLLRDGGIEP